MKSFFATFGMTFIFCYVFIFFGGWYIFKNIWAVLALAALIISVLITAFISLETRIEELESTIKTQESQYKQ